MSEFSQKDLEIFVSILKGESFKRTGEKYNISSDEVKKTINRLYLHAWKRGYFKPVEKHTNDINVTQLRKDPDYYISVVTDMIEGKELPGGTASKKRITKRTPRHNLLWLTDDPPDEDSNEEVTAARKVLDRWKEEKVKEIALLAPKFFKNQDDWNEDSLCTEPDSIDQLMNWFDSLEFIFSNIEDPLSDPFDGFNINIRELISVLILMEAFCGNPFAATKGAMILVELNEKAREKRLGHIITTWHYAQQQGLGHENLKKKEKSRLDLAKAQKLGAKKIREDAEKRKNEWRQMAKDVYKNDDSKTHDELTSYVHKRSGGVYSIHTIKKALAGVMKEAKKEIRKIKNSDW